MDDEEWEMEQRKNDPKIVWFNGEPLIELPPGSIVPKRPTQDPANHPFTFGWLQEKRERESMPGIIKEIEEMFKFPTVPVKWKVFKITEQGEIKEIREDEENDNEK